MVLVLAMRVAGCQQPPAAEPLQKQQPQNSNRSAPAEATAPAEPAAPAETPVIIRALIRPDEGENVATYAAKFEEMTGNKVEVDFASWAEIHDKTITTLATGGGGYDIIFIPSANVVEFSSGAG
jgi:ABC-type glycerol-3-phosphate transport system substrate-binding protein